MPLAAHAAPPFAEQPLPISIQQAPISASVLKRLPPSPLASTLRPGDKVSPLAPAPGLRKLQIYLVESEKGKQEPISEWQQQTQRAHGGSNFYVYVFEDGYGQSYAQVNGRSLPTSTDQGVCPDGSGSWRNCRIGESIPAWVKRWSLNGFGSGKFETWSNSVAWPFTTLRDELTIL